MKTVVIVGGGISGLSCAYALQEKAGKDVKFLLIEKEERLGGQVLTERIDGFIVEGGPDCFISTKPWVIELSGRLGIEERLINTNDENKRIFILSKGKLHLLPEGMLLLVPTKFSPFITSSLISWPGKVRMGLDLFLPRRRDNSDESLASFVRRRLGREALDKIAEPLIGGIHASDPERMSVKATFPQLLRMEREYGSLVRAALVERKKARRLGRESTSKGSRRTFFVSFIGGMQDLVDALVKALRDETVLLGVKVTKVEQQVSRQSLRPKYKVYVEGRKPGEIEADAVVFSTLSYVTANIIENLDISLASLLKTIPCVSSVTVSLAFRKSQVNHPLNGFGFIVPRSEGRRIIASTWSSAKWNYRVPEGYVLLRAFIGGIYGQELVDLDDQSVENIVCEELEDIMGIGAKPVFTRIFRWREAMPQYTVYHLERLAKIKRRLVNYPGLFLTGASYRGVGVPDCVHNATGVAEDVVAFLKNRPGE